MKKSIIFGILIIVLFPLLGFEWPVDEIVLKKTFGEDYGGIFNSGITLGGGRQEVSSVDAGEVIFYFSEHETSIGFPSGLGNFVVVEHKRSLYSIYSHLEEIMMHVDTDYKITSADTLGWVGDSGDAPGLQLGLEIVDLEFNQMVNPLKLLPPRADSSRPVIAGLWMADDGWKLLEDGESLFPGEREIFISVYDQSGDVPYFRPMAPYKINVFANGEEIFFQTFESIEARNGELFLITKQNFRSFSQLYNEEGFIRLGNYTFNPGETIFEIIVSDFRGNKTFSNIDLQVVPR